MKWLKIISLFLVAGVITFLSFGCSGRSNATDTVRTQLASVQKGSITIDVTGTGNLALSRTQDLAFEVAGTVAEILVSESQSVTKDQVLAKLDTAVWDKQIKTLEKTLETATRNLATKENDLIKTQRQISAREISVEQAKLDLQSAENNLDQIADIKEVQDRITKLTSDLEFARKMRQTSVIDDTLGIDPIYWDQMIKDLAERVNEANRELKELKAGTSVNISSNLALQIANIKLQIVQKKRALEDAQIAVEDAKASVNNAVLAKSDAEQAVKDARSDVDESKSLNPIIKAPFDGFITRINVKGGDEVQKGRVALQLADPNQFEANIMVTEKDIFSVKVGGEATVSLDALSGLSFPARITKIAPLATVQQGVVNYKVTVELTSLRPTSGGLTARQRSTQLPSGNWSGETSPFSFSGTSPAGSFPIPTSFPRSGELPSGTPGTVSSTTNAATGINLKDGLTAMVSIIVQQKNDILLVPNRALSRQGRDTIVHVQTGDVIENRVVRTGVADLQNTEIIEGLSEGEQIVITTSASTSTSTSNTGMPGGFRIGGPVRVP